MLSHGLEWTGNPKRESIIVLLLKFLFVLLYAQNIFSLFLTLFHLSHIMLPQESKLIETSYVSIQWKYKLINNMKCFNFLLVWKLVNFYWI